jgi:tryptophanyl-tRNA synthetase
MVQRVLTGITTSGMPHLGNYAGAIRPAIAASRQAGVESFYFLADYHALQDGAAKARAIATPFLAELRRAVGLRKLF